MYLFSILFKFHLNVHKKKPIVFKDKIPLSKESFSINKKIENNNELYTFLNSILSIGDEIFTLNTFQNKKNIMKNLIKKMDDDLIKNDLYFLYNYDKNRKFNKEKKTQQKFLLSLRQNILY